MYKNKSIPTTELKKILSADSSFVKIGTNPKNLGKSRQRKSNMLRKFDRVKINSGKILFNIPMMLCLMFALIAVICLIQICFYLMMYPDAQKLKNIIDIYCVGIDSWNILYWMHHAWFSTIMWNNTHNYFGTGDSRTAYT